LAVAVAVAEGLAAAVAVGLAVAVAVGFGAVVAVAAGFGVWVSVTSGVAVSRGLTVALGDGLGAAVVAVGRVVAVGVGDSPVAAGLLCWNGVEAASCARTSAAAARKTVARTIRRMEFIRLFPWESLLGWTLARARPRGQAE
jgi:hypothetical protein